MPATAKGIVALLDHHGVELAGRRAVVVGRSELVGRPVATLLSQRDSTVTVCHSRSRDLEQECRRADVLIAAAGKPHLISEAHVRRGATVWTWASTGAPRASPATSTTRRSAGVPAAVSLVPGGVGPMTIASLLENTLAASHSAAGRGLDPDLAPGDRDAGLSMRARIASNTRSAVSTFAFGPISPTRQIGGACGPRPPPTSIPSSASSRFCTALPSMPSGTRIAVSGGELVVGLGQQRRSPLGAHRSCRWRPASSCRAQRCSRPSSSVWRSTSCSA